MTRRQLTDSRWKFIEPYLPIGGCGPYPERLRDQFEGVIWRFRSGAQWREIPSEFGRRPTVYGRFRVWRDAGVFEALLEGLIAEAAKRGAVDLSLVSVDSTPRWAARKMSRARMLRPGPGPARLRSPGPRRVAALLAPVPYTWPPAHSPAILATMFAAAETTVTAVSVLNAAVALLLILKVTTPL